jgi:hypothetical protein
MMFELLQTVITVALSAIVGGQVAVTRTRRLQRTIDATISLRDRLPADDPSRAMLEANLRELVEVLVRRQRLRFGPFTQAGFSLGAIAGLASVALAFAGFGALMAAAVVPPASASDPMTTGEAWAGAAFFLAVGGALGVWAARIARRQLREHPPPAKQPAEAG